MGPPAKRRKVSTSAVEELNFDPDARKEFLTGFHKRKVQRAKHAQEIAERRAKEERVETRRKVREERNADVQRALEVNKAMMASMRDSTDEESGGSEGEDGDDEWEGFAEPPPVDYEAEYIDEDKYTTVTVEDLDPSKEEDPKPGEEQVNGEKTAEQKAQNPAPSIPSKNHKAKGKPDKSKSKKKFRYETKTERKVAQVKARVSKSSRAKARREK